MGTKRSLFSHNIQQKKTVLQKNEKKPSLSWKTMQNSWYCDFTIFTHINAHSYVFEYFYKLFATLNLALQDKSFVYHLYNRFFCHK